MFFAFVVVSCIAVFAAELKFFDVDGKLSNAKDFLIAWGFTSGLFLIFAAIIYIVISKCYKAGDALNGIEH